MALEKLATDGLAKTAGLQATIADEINKTRSEAAKREASRANVLAWIRAQPNPAEYAVLARNNGISAAELRS